MQKQKQIKIKEMENKQNGEVLQTTKEEIANTVTHGLAIALSLVGAVFIYYWLAADPGSGWRKWFSGSVYLLSLIILYTASTLYHAVNNLKWKQFLRIGDHSAIYIKIAGTYTPFLLLAFPLSKGLPWLVFLWVLAGAGIAFKVFFTKRFSAISVLLYLFMGWTALFMIHSLYTAVSSPVFWCILAGGLFFTSGLLFFFAKKIPYHHSIWHLFVMTGSAFHYAGIFMLFFN